MPVYRLGNGDDYFESRLVGDWTNDSTVLGGNGEDTIIATALSPTFTSRLVVRGGNGDDVLRIDASNSFAFGGNGDDALTAIGGLGNTLDGGNGDDLLLSFGGGSGMGQGNTLTGGPGEDSFRFTNDGNLVVTKDAGSDRVVSDGDVFFGPTDVITDYEEGEPIALRTFSGPDDVPTPTRVRDVALTTDPLSAAGDRFRPVLGDGEYALFQGTFEGGGMFTVGSNGDDLLVIYDAFDGDDDAIAQGSLVLLGVTAPSAGGTLGGVILGHDPSGAVGLVNLASGAFEPLGAPGVGLTDLDVNPAITLGYGVSFSDFFTIDLATGAATRVGATGATLNALEVSANGTIYAAGLSGPSLYTINPGTGAATPVFDTGFLSGGDLQFVGDTLYLANITDELVAIDVSAQTATLVGPFGVPAVYGLALDGDGDLVGLSADRSISLIDVATGAASPVLVGEQPIWGAATYYNAASGTQLLFA